MKKMPCLFVRTFHGKSSFTLTREVTPGCEWVMAGEGVATRKWDGTACAVIGGRLYKRLDCKKDRLTGDYKSPPAGAIPCDDPDPVTGHWPHWIPVGDEPESKHHVAAWNRDRSFANNHEDGTYELCGPHFQANPQGLDMDMFISHGLGSFEVDERSFDGIRATLVRLESIEGIVFHHPDGRMCKIRRADFGLPWGAKK